MSQNKDIDPKSFSDRLVTLVQVIFAVVIGGGLIELHDILFSPENAITFWALIVVFLTAIMSWTGYHSSMERYPYTYTGFGIFRLFFDILIVATYVFLLFVGNSKEMLSELYLVGFSFVFLLYIGSGLSRRAEYRDKIASWTSLLVPFFIASVIVAVLFIALLRYTHFDKILVSQIFVGFPFLMMIAFRFLREWTHLKWRN